MTVARCRSENIPTDQHLVPRLKPWRWWKRATYTEDDLEVNRPFLVRGCHKSSVDLAENPEAIKYLFLVEELQGLSITVLCSISIYCMYIHNRGDILKLALHGLIVSLRHSVDHSSKSWSPKSVHQVLMLNASSRPVKTKSKERKLQFVKVLVDLTK
ncbi:hypothetical protein BX600DRAFT_176540 [Xylariales sp. PMI_506]|nr:hypothetical protein BX600DRAFT_176540 [Xylariales sp. PMI_506]